MTESLAKEFYILCLSMDEEVDELGDGLEDFEIDVEFVSYTGSREFNSLGVGNSARRLFINDCTLGLAGDKITFFFQNFIAFHIKLNTPTQHYCKIFLYGIVMPASCCTL